LSPEIREVQEVPEALEDREVQRLRRDLADPSVLLVPEVPEWKSQIQILEVPADREVPVNPSDREVPAARGVPEWTHRSVREDQMIPLVPEVREDLAAPAAREVPESAYRELLAFCPRIPYPPVLLQ